MLVFIFERNIGLLIKKIAGILEDMQNSYYRVNKNCRELMKILSKN